MQKLASPMSPATCHSSPVTYKVYTLGCKLNYAESSTIARHLQEQGYAKAQREQAADIVIINSCSVTSQADHKARELIRRAVRENPTARIVVTGCYAKLKPEQIAAIEGVSQVEADKSKLFAPLRSDNFFQSYSSGDRTRSFLKVQDGCDYHCSYCAVWRARGESRNVPINDIVSSARQIAKSGTREIVLTGVNIGDFGRSTGETFLQLITHLAAVQGIDRYRISSIEPNLLTNDIIEFCAQNHNFMPHFHIPLQSGCDTILKRMGRRYTTDMFADKVAQVRRAMPHAFIGVDVIVGFPGESDADFNTTLDFLKTIHPSYLHIFPYSQRDNTTAAAMPQQIAPRLKQQRVAAMEVLNENLRNQFRTSELSLPHTVLIEGRDKLSGLLFGHTENYLKIEIPGDDNLINQIITT